MVSICVVRLAPGNKTFTFRRRVAEESSYPSEEIIYWKTDGASSSQEIFSPLWKPNSLHYYSLSLLKISAGIKGDYIPLRPLFNCEMCIDNKAWMYKNHKIA